MGGLGYLDDADTAFAADQEILETDGAGALLRRYIRLPGSVDETFLTIDVSGGAPVETWAHADRLGSVVAVTDSAGAVIEKYRYSPYGVSGAEGTGGFPFRFTGQKLDPETGLYYYKARYYDPETGRFLQTDPIGYADGMNMYAYVRNDPVNATDPTGLAKTQVCIDGVCGDWTDTGSDNSFTDDVIVVEGTRRNNFRENLGFWASFSYAVDSVNKNGGLRVEFGGGGSAGPQEGRKREDEEYRTCLNALSQLRQSPNYGASDKVLGVLLYRNVFGATRYGSTEVIAYQTNPAQSTFSDDVYITVPNINNCEGTRNAQELRDCARRRRAPFATDPGNIYSFGNSGLPLAGFGQTPFALLVSGLANLPKLGLWADELGIPEDRILDESCEALK